MQLDLFNIKPADLIAPKAFSVPSVPQEVIDAQVIFVNHSGGKDSQAMMAYLANIGMLEKLVVVHADLGVMEWEAMRPFIEANAMGREVHVVEPELDFFELCRKYKRLPSGQARFCTDQLKTQPIKKWIRNYCEAKGITRAINAIGIRAEESPARAMKSPWELSKVSKKASNLVVWEWYPIFNYKLADVWAEIESVGQKPHHIYGQGFSRLSCVFCVFGRIEEHKKAAQMKPELYARMVELEKELGRTIRVKQINGVKYPKYLDEYCG